MTSTRRWALIVALGLLVSVACDRETREAIVIEGRVLTVHNATTSRWDRVEIWVNDHYRVTRERMTAGERFSVPLDSFVAGFGQRFNPARQVAQSIEVTARTPDGQPVTLVWGRPRRR